MGGWVKRRVEIDGRRISVRERGPGGRILILLHGLGAHQRTWDRVVKHLDGFHVVTFDYAGHGRSDPSDEYSVDRLLDDLASLVSQLDIGEGYVAVGHSIGADLALLHARGAHACRGIVLVDGAFNVSPPETDWEKFSIMEDRLFF